MIAAVAQYLGGKVLTAILIVAGGLTAYYFYKNPDDIKSLWNVVKGSLVWLGFVAALPWGLFFLPGMAVRTDSNLAAVALLAAYLALDILMAFYLTGWQVGGTLAWGVLLLGFLVAGVYNFIVCDFLAERSEESI